MMFSKRSLFWAGAGAITTGGILLGAASISQPRRLAFDIFFPNTFFSGDRKKPEIALTFDDGPHPVHTKNMLAVLNYYDVKASFFMTGKNIISHPDVAKMVLREGHEVGNHSYSHVKLPFCSTQKIAFELERTHAILLSLLGQQTLLFRPPYGFRDWRVLRQAQKMGYTTVFWDVTTYDWKRQGVRKIVQKTASVQNGSILLFHDGRGDRSQTVKAVEIIIDRLLKKGYKFRTIGQLLNSN